MGEGANHLVCKRSEDLTMDPIPDDGDEDEDWWD